MGQLDIRAVGLVEFQGEIAKDAGKGHVELGVGQAAEREKRKGELANDKATRGG